MKQLYFGDCLDILKDLSDKNPNGFIDLIYIDPPFNSKRNYNILFEDVDMSNTKAQREAFADTWSNVSYKDTLGELADLNYNLYELLLTLDKINIQASSVAYLTTMAIRIYYIHKVLKNTGSFYLHCDTNMSHYLKLICDLIFGRKEEYFRNEIVWKRTSAHNDPNRFGKNADRILFYNKSGEYTFNPVHVDYDEKYLKKFYSKSDENGRFTLDNITGPGVNNQDPEYKKYHPKDRGRSWSVPKEKLISIVGKKVFEKMSTFEKLEKLDAEGLIYFTKNGTPRYKRYLDSMHGAPAQEIWTDLPPISPHAKERLGYPTQKPLALMERIIRASSNEGDIVADFFCGCGTTIAAANKLNRNWIGADISHLAIKLILKRMTDPIKEEGRKKFLSDIEINGFPKDIDSAKQLAKSDMLLQKKSKHGAFDFQHWIVEFMLGGIRNPKEIADGGWDGYITFPKNNKEKGRVLIEVKSGKVNVKSMREFINVIDKEAADIGVFVCFEDYITKPMLAAAKEAGKYKPYKFDRIQIITVEDLFAEKEIKMPGGVESSLFKTSVKESRPDYIDPNLFE